MFMDFGGYPNYYSANVGYDSTKRFGTISKVGFPTVGTFVMDTLQLSDPQRATFWAINNDHRVAGNPFGTLDGFTQSERWRSISSYAGNRTATAGNLAYVITAPIRDVAPGASTAFVFGHIVGVNSALLQNAAASAIQFLRSTLLPVNHLESLPHEILLGQNYPNPVSNSITGGTTIEFSIPETGNTRLELFNAIGLRIRVFFEGHLEAGIHKLTFDTKELKPGIYFYQLMAGESKVQRAMIVSQ